MKKLFLLISIIFIYSCGYSPLYLAGKNDLLLNLKKIEGDFELNNYIKNDFKIASDNNSKNVFDINAETKFEKIILTKDATGDATDYRLDFTVKFIIISENKEVSYKESFKIKKNDQKFEQSNYEKEIKRNFSEIVKDKLVLYLLNLDDN
ncbi:hypothetical protein [Candidatus Pelagibacter sp. HIMB1587]|uniref:hypothetical protein n=1 Tax=Candidatus Pelagibacter sp. HIMB1587 TaxID=3413354 RepID=UPI003F83C0FC